MEQTDPSRLLEALLLVFGQPLAIKRIVQILPLEVAGVRRIIESLNAEYDSSNRSFRIQEVAGGYQLVTHPVFAPWIRKALQNPRPDSVSAATMETLAIIAYRQPITKAEVEAIRGVDISASIDTLLERQFIRTAGRKETPGRPFLYATTPQFLWHFGLASIESLPRMELPVIPEPTAEEMSLSSAPTHPDGS